MLPGFLLILFNTIENMINNRIKAPAQESRRHADVVRPELANRADRIWAIIEPGLKNFAVSELSLLNDFIVAKLREYRATAELEIIKA